MSDYAADAVYTDLFSQGFVLPPTPNCRGGDFNRLPLEQCVGSSVNVGTGRLSHEQELFSLKSGQPLSLDITLYYRSIQFAPSGIGNGWSHTYETALQIGSNGFVTAWTEGKRRMYRLYNNAFYSPNGDYSTLIKNGDGTYTITEKDGLKRNFSSTGAATSIVDRNNNVLTFTYTSGKLTSVTDPNNRTATFGYDGNNKLSTVTDPKGNIYVLGYTSGKLTSVANPDGGAWGYTYATNGLIETKTDTETYQVTYSYDTNNRLSGVLDPRHFNVGCGNPGIAGEGKVPDCYPISSIPLKNFVLTQKDGGGWTYTFNVKTETISSMTDPYNNTTSYTYDDQGNMLTKTEPGISSTLTATYTYDNKGNVLSVHEPMNRTTYFTYNSFSSIQTITGAPGNYTNSFDARGNLKVMTGPTGTIVQLDYDPKGNLTTITDARNNITTVGYDTNNNITTITLADGATTTFTDYDANGNAQTMIDAHDKVATFAYDSRNRPATITDPLLSTTTYSYDKNGNLKTITDANGKTTTNSYNYLGQITSTLDAISSLTTFSYGAAGCPSCTGVDQLVALFDARNQKTSWTYDKLGRLQTETDPLMSATTYSYGAVRMPLSKTDANGATIVYGYDNLKRLTQKTYPVSSATYSYDLRNNIVNAANSNVSYVYTYYEDNRLWTVTDSRGSTITYEYDTAGNRKKMTVNSGGDQKVYDYTYDNRNRPEMIISSAGTFSFGYNLLDQRTSLIYPNQITTSYGYDEAGRLKTITTNPLITQFTYSYDKVGNRKAKTGTTNESYDYDDIYRLKQANLPEGTENFTYDAVGNRLTGPGPKDTAYQHNAANEMTHGRVLGYGYDNDGNQTTRTVPNGPDRTWTQTWDYENRLIKVEKIKGTERRTVTFTYDPFNRRIGKQLTTVIDGVTKTYTWAFVYDNSNIALEVFTDSTGAVTKTWYTQGPGIDEHLALERNGSSYYYHADALGSIIAITDSSRNTVQSYTYDSYGLPKPSTSFTNSYTYTGREWDPQAGLYYYRARYYDPMDGRFISKDPIGFEGGDSNLFAYVGNNTVRWIDPDGLDWVDTCVDVSAGLGDALLFGYGDELRAWTDEAFGWSGTTAVNRCSKAYRYSSIVTSVAMLFAGSARLAYAGAAKGISWTARSYQAAVNSRNALKIAFRFGIDKTSRIYTAEEMIKKYGTAREVIGAAGRTNTAWNIAGGAGVAGAINGFFNLPECGCDKK